MSHHGKIRLFFSTAAALGLCSCAVKDGRLDFTWWQDAAAPVLEDDVIIESAGNGYYRSTPAPARVPAVSIPKPEEEKKPEPAPAPEPVVTQQQPVTQTPQPAPARKPARKPALQTVPGIHIVQPGDTLSALARRYNTTVSALVAANGMPNANATLRINQQLKLPTSGTPAASPAPAAAPKPEPAAPASTAPKAPAPGTGSGTYKVKAGDTIYRISRQHGISPTALMQANGLTLETATTLQVGTTLKIPVSN